MIEIMQALYIGVITSVVALMVANWVGAFLKVLRERNDIERAKLEIMKDRQRTQAKDVMPWDSR